MRAYVLLLLHCLFDDSLIYRIRTLVYLKNRAFREKLTIILLSGACPNLLFTLTFLMPEPSAAPGQWTFTRPDPHDSSHQYFRSDLRHIAGQQLDYYLLWQDDMYLAYPTQDSPDWRAFMEHVKHLNEEAGANEYYKVLYIMRPAHSMYYQVSRNKWKYKSLQTDKDLIMSQGASGDTTTIDLSIDTAGEQECIQLLDKFSHAMQTKGIPPPDAIVTSPLARTLQTTQLGVAPLFPTVKPIILEDLRETLDGQAKNKRHSKEWIHKTFATFQVDNVDPNDSLGSRHVASAESYKDLWTRVHKAFQYIFENLPEALVVLIVSHCHAEQTIQREITGWDVPEAERREKVEFYVGNALVYAMIVKGVRTA
jgi:broad specificity phosphatase PhoE